MIMKEMRIITVKVMRSVITGLIGKEKKSSCWHFRQSCQQNWGKLIWSPQTSPEQQDQSPNPRAAPSHKDGKQEPHKGAITKMEECGAKERSQRVGGRDNKWWQKPDWLRTEPLIPSPRRKPNFSHKILPFHPAAHLSYVFETSDTQTPIINTFPQTAARKSLGVGEHCWARALLNQSQVG